MCPSRPTSSLLPFLAAVRPLGDTCEDLQGGYCHRRTHQDEEFVKKWKEDKGRGPFIRRHIEDVDASPPSDPFVPAEYEPVNGILLAFDGSSKGTNVYDLSVIAGSAVAVTKPMRTRNLWLKQILLVLLLT